jgi:DNA-directed RNA polymerase specialized sigma24 family protein
VVRETDDSFAEWYRAAHPGLLEDVLRAVARPALAEDALDAAFEKAFLRWDAVQAMRSPDGWVYRVAVNAARRAMARELREGDRLAFAAGRPAHAPPPGGETWLLVRGLPIRQRTAVVLRHVGGLTEAEVADAMGVTRSTVSSSLASAYKTLGRALAEPSPEEPRPMPDIHLAVATRCTGTGAHVEPLDGSAPSDARWSDAVRDVIKVRPGDLVAVRAGEVVWRWWGGTVVDVGDERVTVQRNVTQRADSDPRTATMEVALPEELRGSVANADRVWFDHDAVVAVGAPETVIDRLAPHLPIVDAFT